MALEKEARTNIMGSSLDIRNRNWGKVDDHMLETAEDDVHGLSGAVIVESGSNENGYYVKYGDGTMICWSTAEVSYGDQTTLSYTWTFPHPFIDDHMSVSPNIALPPHGKRNCYPRYSSVTETSCIVGLYNHDANFEAGDKAEARPQAIGRWK